MGNLLGQPVTEKETHTGETEEGLVFGVSSMQGWRVHMEDAHICQPHLYAEELISEEKEQQQQQQPARTGSNATDAETEPVYNKILLPGHSLFGVFDGHGGTFAAEYAGRNLCRVLSRRPEFVNYAKFFQEQPELNEPDDDDSTNTTTGGNKRRRRKKDVNRQQQAQIQRDSLLMLEDALRNAFIDMDREIMREVRGLGNPDSNTPYGLPLDAKIINGQAHVKQPQQPPKPADKSSSSSEEDAKLDDADVDAATAALGPTPAEDEDSGTTAVVVLLTPRTIVCANAGDSRAVYSKSGGRTVPLSYDHKPDDEEEVRRISDAGGYVSGGRVEGDLAVSRGLGDFRFKNVDTVLAGSTSNDTADGDNSAMLKVEDQKVSPIPDIIVQSRHANDDEFIIIACDGIWDVQTNPDCIKMVSEIFGEGEKDIGLVCEEVLDVCLGKGSKDNMTALIIRLEAQKDGQGGGVKARREEREERENAEKQEQEGEEKYDENPFDS